MHVYFNPEDYTIWLDYYTGQAAQTGYGVDGFHGVPYQRGAGLGSFFRSLFRMAVPVLKSVGRNVGKHALTAGANIATDIVKGRPLFESAKDHSRRETSHLLDDASKALQQSGQGLGIRPTSINTKTDDVFSKTKQNNGSRRRKINSQY